MKPKSRFIVGWLLCVMLLGTGCSGTVESDTPPPPVEEELAAAADTLSPSPSPSPTPTPVLQISNTITSRNAAQIQELWRIGSGVYEEVKWSQDQPAKDLGYFLQRFSGIRVIQLVRQLEREKTFPSGLEIRTAGPWLQAMPF